MLKTRLLEDNLGKQLHDLRIGSNKQKAQFIKKKIQLHENKVLFIKNIMKRVKRQATKQKWLPVIHLYPKYIKNFNKRQTV